MAVPALALTSGKRFDESLLQDYRAALECRGLFPAIINVDLNALRYLAIRLAMLTHGGVQAIVVHFYVLQRTAFISVQNLIQIF